MDLAQLRILLGILPRQKHLVGAATSQCSSMLVSGAHVGFHGTKVDRRSVFIAGQIVCSVFTGMHFGETEVKDILCSKLPVVKFQDVEAVHQDTSGATSDRTEPPAHFQELE